MKQSRGKTIQIFLPDGNPRGVKISEFTSRPVQIVLSPRAHLDFACGRQELSNVGVYFLVGDESVGTLPKLYIGEAESCTVRLKQQNKTKDWWTVAIACISNTGAFTKADVRYLEWFCHQEAVAAGRYNVDNSSLPTKPHLSEPRIADLMEHFDTISTLVGANGYPFFDPIAKPAPAEALTCKGKRALAKGEYSEDGLVVFAGSIATRPEANALHDYLRAIRLQLLADHILEVVDEETLRFTKDRIFPSPSQAAAVVLARNANGWIEWKYPDGRTLDEEKRK